MTEEIESNPDPVPTTSSESDTDSTTNSPLPPPAPVGKTETSSGKKKVLVIGAVVVLLLGYLVFGRGSSEKTAAQIQYFAYDSSDEIYLASLKDDSVVTSARLGSEVSSIRYYENLTSTDFQDVIVVSSKDTYLVWNDDEISAISKKNLTSSNLYRGESIYSVSYIADKKTLIINDDSNCFALPEGKSPTRIASGSCQIINGRIFTIETSSNSTDINEVDLIGTSINRFSLGIAGSASIHIKGDTVSGLSSEGVFEVYSTIDGKRLYAASANETVTVLDESREVSAFLVAIENSELEDETLDIGVLTMKGGSGAFTKLSSVSTGSGWLSPDASSALIVSTDKEGDTSSDLNLWTVESAKAQPISQGVGEILAVSDDGQGRVAILTDREFIVGSFDTNFSTRSTATYESGTFYFHPDGVVGLLEVKNKYDLVYVENGQANNSGDRTITLATNTDSLQISDTSFAVKGYFYYLESSNNYSDLYRQKLKKDSERERVAEGRIEQFSVETNGRLYFHEKDGDNVTSFVQKNEKPESRIQVSGRYIFSPRYLGINKNLIKNRGLSRISASATIDEDLKTCRSNNYSFVNTGSSTDLKLTRKYTFSAYYSDYSMFCVRNASKVSITSSVRNDGSETKYVGIECSDSETYRSPEALGNHATDEVSLELPKGVLVCGVYDNNNYYSFYDDDPVLGMTVTVSVE